MDMGTGLTMLGAAGLSVNVVEKILGPTADYLGDRLRGWTTKRFETLGKIFQSAKAKLGDRLEIEGSVPPKVLKNILENGSYCVDDLSVEYFGGVLASSRTGVSRDDRGAAFASIVGRLTTYQIRTHYYFYGLWKELFNGMGFNVAVPQGRDAMQIFIPMGSYVDAMEFSEKEDFHVVLTHAIIGLARESLIDSNYNFGLDDHLKAYYSAAPGPGILVRPSSFGVELFHWAHGRGDMPIHRFLDRTIEFRSNIEIRMTNGPTERFTRGTIYAEPFNRIFQTNKISEVILRCRSILHPVRVTLRRSPIWLAGYAPARRDSLKSQRNSTTLAP